MNEQLTFFDVRTVEPSYSDANTKTLTPIAFWPSGCTPLLKVQDPISDGLGIFHEHCVPSSRKKAPTQFTVLSVKRTFGFHSFMNIC